MNDKERYKKAQQENNERLRCTCGWNMATVDSNGLVRCNKCGLRKC